MFQDFLLFSVQLTISISPQQFHLGTRFRLTHFTHILRFKILDISPRIPQDTTEPQETGPQIYVLFFWFNVASTIFQSYHSGVWSFTRAVSSPSPTQSVEALYFTTELHTSSVRVHPAREKIFIWGKKCMWFGCRLPVALFHRHIPGMPRYVRLSS